MDYDIAPTPWGHQADGGTFSYDVFQGNRVACVGYSQYVDRPQIVRGARMIGGASIGTLNIVKRITTFESKIGIDPLLAMPPRSATVQNPYPSAHHSNQK